MSKSYPWALAGGLLLFAAVHLTYEPYRTVRSVGESDAPVVLQAGAPSRLLFPLLTLAPGEQYRVVGRVTWEDAAGDPNAGWRMARVIFASFNEQGRWIPSRHVLCAVSGSGAGTFSEVFRIPADAATVRFELQHLGVAGRIGLEAFSVEQVVPKPGNRWLFGGLAGIWIILAAWSAKVLRLTARTRGWLVLLSAALIIVGMLIPGEVLLAVKLQAADWVRPPPLPPAAPASPAGRPILAVQPQTPPGPDNPASIHTARIRAERAIRRADPHRSAHLGLFALLGLACGGCFLAPSRSGKRIFQVLLGGALYALAAELLQVAELSRSVRVADFGHNLTGFAAGVTLFAVPLWGRFLKKSTVKVIAQAPARNGRAPERKGRGSR